MVLINNYNINYLEKDPGLMQSVSNIKLEPTYPLMNAARAIRNLQRLWKSHRFLNCLFLELGQLFDSLVRVRLLQNSPVRHARARARGVEHDFGYVTPRLGLDVNVKEILQFWRHIIRAQKLHSI